MLRERKQRWLDFYDNRNVPFMFLIDYYPDVPERPWPNENYEQRIEWAVDKYRSQRARCEWLHDDTIPHLAPFTGTEIFAEAFGCQVVRSNDKMPFALPVLTETRQISQVKCPTLESSSLMRYFEIADRLISHAEDREAVLKLVDIQSPLDIAALILEKSQYYMAFLTEPEAIHDLGDMAGTLLTEFLDAWFDRYGTEYMAHHPDYFMSGGVTLSEDEIGAVGRIHGDAQAGKGVGMYCRKLFDGSEIERSDLGGAPPLGDIEEAPVPQILHQEVAALEVGGIERRDAHPPGMEHFPQGDKAPVILRVYAFILMGIADGDRGLARPRDAEDLPDRAIPGQGQNHQRPGIENRARHEAHSPAQKGLPSASGFLLQIPAIHVGGVYHTSGPHHPWLVSATRSTWKAPSRQRREEMV